MDIRVRVISEAKKELIEKIKEGQFRVFVREKPLRGEANKRVREVFARYFHVSVDKVRLMRGHHKPAKIFFIKISS